MTKLTDEIVTLKDRALNWKKRSGKKIMQLKANKDLDIDFMDAHEQVFSTIDCLECANCCKTTGPLFTRDDVDRLSRHLRLSPRAFTDKFLQRDETEDLALQNLPCPFLNEDNSCAVYEVRPKACRQYPHTDTRNQKQILHLTLKNAEICPGVLAILQKISKTSSG